MTLELDSGLLSTHGCLRDCVAQGIYQRGLKRVAGDLDVSPGNLSVALSADPHRKFSIDDLERYIQTSGDKAPIYYLVAKYLGDEAATRDHTLAQMRDMLQSMLGQISHAGVAPAAAKARR